MAKPLLSVRIPLELDALLTAKEELDGKNRSEVTIEALLAYLKPPNPEEQLANLIGRVEVLERVVRNILQC